MEVPGYTEIRELGHGGTGRVMLAVRESDGLAVAVKHLSEALRHDTAFLTRFRSEALVIKEIDSPHTARVLDYAETGDDAAIIMELVEGVTLRRLLEHEGATGPEAALTVLKGALLGLAEAHRHGVVHRDFKPENVLITQDGDSKLVDFGVAAHVGETAELSGTPSYMAPEQWDDAPAGPQTDVYAAALVFYECLTGHRAFHAENVAALAYQHQHVPPPLDDVEEPLRPLVEHGLAKDPADRPESAQAFLAEMEEAARAAYGEDWELRGRTGLGILTLPLAALLPRPQAVTDAGTATTLFHNVLSPASKLAVTGGLVLATAAAVASAFVILGGGPEPESGTALPPATSGPPPLGLPSSGPPTMVPGSPTPETPTTPPVPTPEEPIVVTPPITYGEPPAPQPSPSAERPTGDPTRAPTRTPTERPTSTGAPAPTTRPATRPPATPRPESPPRDDPSSENPPPKDDDPPATTQAPTTRAPDPAPTKVKEPLISVSVSVSLGLPLLGGDGDKLVDADVGLGLGSSLLGLVLVPGSALAGRQIVARRVRRRREAEKPEVAHEDG
ncbi:protein kinase [Nonomuraea sp. FMUSA5-5]|uniref:non-specific serine/threonine protein kinase n=1 Tax=Nonomuraea composti TaxID=2720023 RepID=A0ABX1BE79_9ACTN|nr:serine/threonine-protein kinase [Nonomuraea sp. FMUSA5-5]NJP94709.1 protein kinase [Nonomuraea sp. FMUSA5-5]